MSATAQRLGGRETGGPDGGEEAGDRADRHGCEQTEGDSYCRYPLFREKFAKLTLNLTSRSFESLCGNPLLANATAKRLRKGCDWLVANDVSPATGIMGGTENAVILITAEGPEPWPRLSKDAVAERLADRIAQALA